MNTNKNSYILIYSTVMVILIAFLLSFVSNALKDRQEANVKLDKKRQILSSLRIDLRGQDVEALFDKYIIDGWVINSNAELLYESIESAFEIEIVREMAKPLKERQLPVYIADVDGQRKLIISLRGAGLWGPLWGYVALNDDRNTIFGAYFSHEAETPGLGSNIIDAPFQNQFIGKHILNEKREFVSVAVMKAGQRAEGREQVDALSGGTITSKGVEAMLFSSLNQYDAFFQQEEIRQEKIQQEEIEQPQTTEGGEE